MRHYFVASSSRLCSPQFEVQRIQGRPERLQTLFDEIDFRFVESHLRGNQERRDIEKFLPGFFSGADF